MKIYEEQEEGISEIKENNKHIILASSGMME
jgi:hypothetical protein